jgi:pyrimidine operon attenuation protein/uracil phosphoribosyltransferase
MSKNIILNSIDIENKIRRIAYQIYEANVDESEIIIAGIEKNGSILAQRIELELKNISDLKVDICNVKMNKNDVFELITTSLSPEKYKNKSIVLVDDVLHSGSTLMYAIKHFLNVPLKMFKTAVLVDRNHKRFPVKIDFKGISLSTSLQNHVEVVLSDTINEAYLA